MSNFRFKSDLTESWLQNRARFSQEKHVFVETNATELHKDIALAFGCIDYDHCNERVIPQGSCDDCILHAMEVVEKLKAKGYNVTKENKS